MRSRNFVDEEVFKEYEKIPNSGNDKDKFPEHSFLASSLKIGLTINDLKELSYIDVMKIFLTYIDVNEYEKKPTQNQINMLTGWSNK